MSGKLLFVKTFISEEERELFMQPLDLGHLSYVFYMDTEEGTFDGMPVYDLLVYLQEDSPYEESTALRLMVGAIAGKMLELHRGGKEEVGA